MNDTIGRPEQPLKVEPSNLTLSKYREHVAHLDMSDAAKDELLNVVWRIMGNFVNRAFGDDPVQHVNEIRRRREVGPPSMVGSSKSRTDSKSLSSAFTSPATGRRRKERQ
jgi:hypothetical protein